MRRDGTPRILKPAVLLAGLLIGLLNSAPPADARPPADPPRRIEIAATPITHFDPRDATRQRFGALTFIGGLQLTSPDKQFGGLSGLSLSPDGQHMLSLSDRGRWFRGRIVYRDGRPAGIADAETAPILGAGGRPLAAQRRFDTEALSRADGILYVGIERANEIMRFDDRRGGLAARGEPLAVPPAIKALPHNRGLEALVAIPRGARHTALAGALIAISERGLDADGNITGFILPGSRQRPAATFAVKRRDGYDISDAALLPDGDLVILERFFSFTRGLAMRIRRIAIGAVKPGALVDGPVLIEADMGYQIDNMEGIAAHRAETGDTVLTLVSDDNFLFIQRTILLQFRLAEPPAGQPILTDQPSLTGQPMPTDLR